MKQKWVKRIARAILPCFVFFVFSFSLAPKVYAVEYNGSVTWGWKSTGAASAHNIFQSQSGDLPILNKSQSGSTWYNNLGISYSDFAINLGTSQEFSSNVKLYASYYVVRTNNVSPLILSDDFMNTDSWNVSYINSYGQTGQVEGGLSKYSVFTPAVTGVVNDTGFALEAEWIADSVYPIRNLEVNRPFGVGFVRTVKGDPQLVNLVVPSIRVITTEYTAEMEQLDKVADALIDQNDILTAMKGDIVAILQDIYQMTGDMYIAQNLLNGYVQQMLPLLQSINTQTINIYNLLSSQLRALETAIENAADSIEAAISAQTAAMIAYLESVLNTENEVPDDTYQQQQDAENILDQMESLEKPNVDTIVPVIGDYSDSGVSGVLSAIFSSNLIVTMMTLSASFAFGAYVLFGKRE